MESLIVTTVLEKKLIDFGYESFTLQEKNNLVSLLANRNALVYSDITDAYILEHHKKLKIDILNNICDESISNGFVSELNSHHYRTNRDDQINMIGKKLELQDDQTISVVHWKTEDSGYLEHSREDWLMIYKEACKHKEDNLFRYNILKIQVMNATTHAEVLNTAW